MRGLLTLKDLSKEKIIELIDFAIELKRGATISYSGKKFATLFLRIQQELIIHLLQHL